MSSETSSRALGNLEVFFKKLADLGTPLEREHWAVRQLAIRRLALLIFRITLKRPGKLFAASILPLAHRLFPLQQLRLKKFQIFTPERSLLSLLSMLPYGGNKRPSFMKMKPAQIVCSAAFDQPT